MYDADQLRRETILKEAEESEEVKDQEDAFEMLQDAADTEKESVRRHDEADVHRGGHSAAPTTKSGDDDEDEDGDVF